MFSFFNARGIVLYILVGFILVFFLQQVGFLYGLTSFFTSSLPFESPPFHLRIHKNHTQLQNSTHAMSSSFLSSIRQCDVFVSFRGADTRRNFISHLYRSLDQKGIRTFKDTTVLETDTSHSNELVRAIRECKVAVVVISENYSSSFWCLQDLVMILQSHREGALSVIPVFYGVCPSEAERQTGRVGMHFSEHAVAYPEHVQIWRSSLTELSNIPGEDSSNWDSDADLVDSITYDILQRLNTSTSMDFSGVVGMGHHMEAMLRLLDLGSNKETRKFGIWGEGGVGKTTVARCVYDEISCHFDVHVFLSNVKEIYQSHGSLGLQRALESEYLKGRAPMLSEFNRETLRDQRLLLIADNVEQIEQFDAIAKEIDLVGPGSRVIITTRDRQLLIACGVRLLYEVECLRFPEALQLFSLCAFKQNHPFIGFEELSDRAVKLAGRLPRAIQAVGSRLFGRAKEEWEMVLYSYEVSVLQSTTETRKSSFDRLDFRDKSITGTLRNSESLVGMEYHMEALHKFLDLESINQLRIIGIWGWGGIGKTSLARHIFDEISNHFHGHVFLENIGKMYQDYGPSRLEEEFLSKNIEREVLTTRDSRLGPDVIKRRLGHRKILFIADGVDNKKQLKDVKKIASLFGPGSMVIVTTRDESLLIANGVEHVYEVKCLRYGEALQLFYQFAFKQQTPSTRFKQLSVNAIELAGRLPFAIRVLGSYLCGRTELDWVATIHILEANQGGDSFEEARQYRDNIQEASQKKYLPTRKKR